MAIRVRIRVAIVATKTLNTTIIHVATLPNCHKSKSVFVVGERGCGVAYGKRPLCACRCREKSQYR